MKKNLLLVSAIASITTGFAQLDSITNPNFENWTSSTAPTSWTTIGASQASGGNAYGGTYSLILTTTGSTPAAATATASFRIRPISFTYSAKYTNGGGDAPLVQVTMTKTIGTTTYTVATGSSTAAGNGSYATQTLTINYVAKYHAYSPDKIKISIASSGSLPASGSALYIDNLAFVYSCSLSPNIVSSGYAPSNFPADGDRKSTRLNSSH